MAVRNSDIAALFDELADLLEIEDANVFRVRAYRNAAMTVRDHPQEMAELVAAGARLCELPGIGKDLEGKIRSIVATGKLPLLEEVAARTPRALRRLLKVEGLGPKRVKTLYKELAIQSAEDLQRAVRNGRIRQLRGFGAKLEELIGKSVGQAATAAARVPLQSAEAIAASLIAQLRSIEGVRNVTVAGSYRRRRETVGDLDILVAAARGSPVVERFIRCDEVAAVAAQGRTKSTVKLRDGMQVDLRVVPQASYGAALLYFTGSKAHNIALRKLALTAGYKLNEYGMFRGKRRVVGKTESEIYERLGLPFIPPELREDRGELDAARDGRLPKLVELADLRGDLHCHTTATDGRASLEETAAAAAERGYEYLAITDHSKRVTVANGMTEKRLLAQIAAIDRLNESGRGPVLLKSVELDILEDGTLDLPNRVLKELDLVVCAVHYELGLPKRRQTDRILKAMDNRYVNVLAHPTGRLLNERAPCDLDLPKIMEGAKQRGCCLELDAQPERLDLPDEACKLAKELGVRIAVSSDAHSVGQLDFVRFGVDQARRGWLSAADVINTRGLSELRALLRRP
jgi:DNA polymerase (family 10)